MAHELCHALIHPVPGPEPVDRQSEAYRREERIAHVVGDAVSTMLGFPNYAVAAVKHRFSSWVLPGEMAAEEVAEAAAMVEKITALIAGVSVWPRPGAEHECSAACQDGLHAHLLLVDDPELESALRWVSILAAQDEIEVVELKRAAEQRTPRATIWLLRFRRGAG